MAEASSKRPLNVEGTIVISRRRAFEQISIRLLAGEAAILPVQDQIDALRDACGQSGEMLTSLDYFLPWAKVWKARPMLAMAYRRDRLVGIALIHLRRAFGISIGLARIGEGAGEGSVIGHPADWVEILEAAAEALLKRATVHTVFISAHWEGHSNLRLDRPAARLQGKWQFRASNTRLDLNGGYEATLARFSYKMRRNLRYYRKRAEAELGCAFVAELSPAQRQEAVRALHDRVIFAYSARQAAKLDRVLRSVAGHFAIGLRNAEGEWISYLAGWRTNGATYVGWQLNDERYGRHSLSTVMRNFLLEHEAGRQAGEIVFVGGTSEMWSRVCAPGTSGELVATRGGLVGAVTRRMTLLLRPRGKLAQLYRSETASTLARVGAGPDRA